jgi:hypothetical protein
MSNIVETQSFDLSPRSMDEALRFADYLADSELVPKDFKGKPGNVLVAIQWGMELGLKPMQALQNIAVINGRPSLWGDAVLALVLASPVCEYVRETEENGVAVCRVKRRGDDEHVQTFSDDDAKKAGLIGKQGPWSQYPKRMKKLRARAFALRDKFADVLKGIPIAEEVMDYQPLERDITPKTATAIAAAALPQPAERDDRLTNLILDLEAVASDYGSDALSDSWGKLTKEDRKAIGRSELTRLQEIAAVGETSPATEESSAETDEGQPGADDE